MGADVSILSLTLHGFAQLFTVYHLGLMVLGLAGGIVCRSLAGNRTFDGCCPFAAIYAYHGPHYRHDSSGGDMGRRHLRRLHHGHSVQGARHPRFRGDDARRLPHDAERRGRHGDRHGSAVVLLRWPCRSPSFFSSCLCRCPKFL